MSKADKKKAKNEARIKELEAMLASSLHKKQSGTKEVDVSKILRQIADLKTQI